METIHYYRLNQLPSDSYLRQTLSLLTPYDENAEKQCFERVNLLIKPQGSLGKLEDIACHLSGIYQTPYPWIQKKALIVMCADHGVCEEGVASAPQAVTLTQTLNIPRGLSGVGALSKHNQTKIYTVDLGVNAHFKDSLVIHRKLMMGTQNMTKGPAMTRETAIKALEIGIEIAEKAISEGANLLGTGEMGIGNTTASTAILSALSGISPREITGVGANFPIEKLEHKASVIEKALEVNQPNPEDIIDIIHKVGGLEIIGMAGVMIGGAAHRIPVVVDGYISTIAALIANAFSPLIKPYLFPSHISQEKGAKVASDLMGFDPYLDMNMRLGEGSGCILAFDLIEAACYMNSEMITFEEGGIDIV